MPKPRSRKETKQNKTKQELTTAILVQYHTSPCTDQKHNAQYNIEYYQTTAIYPGPLPMDIGIQLQMTDASSNACPHTTATSYHQQYNRQVSTSQEPTIKPLYPGDRQYNKPNKPMLGQPQAQEQQQ